MGKKWLLLWVSLLVGSAPTWAQTCTPSLTVACLLEGRFQVEVTWSDEADNAFTLPSWGSSGVGTVEFLHPQGEPDTAAFAFFEVGTPTLIVRVLDVRFLNGHFWVFASASTNVAFILTVTDTVTGEVKTYGQSQGEVMPTIQDITAFPLVVQGSPARSTSESPDEPVHAAATSDCAPNTLCLRDGRFEVAVQRPGFFDDEPESGPGFPIPFSDTTGLFWFFDESNLDLMVNVLDGRSVNGHFWVYVASITNIEWTMTVRDHRTGETWIYENPSFVAVPVLDREALPETQAVTAIPTLEEMGIAALMLLLMGSGVFVLRG